MRFDDDFLARSYEYQVAYEVIRHAMTLVDEGDLKTLQNALYKASFFVNDELDDQSDTVEELGLDKWQEAEGSDDEEDEAVDL